MGEKAEISEITDRFVEIDEDTRIEPDPSNVDVYEGLQRLQDGLSSDLRGAFKARGRLRGVNALS